MSETTQRPHPDSLIARLQARLAELPHCPAHDVLLTPGKDGTLDCDVCRQSRAMVGIRGYQA